MPPKIKPHVCFKLGKSKHKRGKRWISVSPHVPFCRRAKHCEVSHLAPGNTSPVKMGPVPKILNHNTYITECRNPSSLEDEHDYGETAAMLGRCDLRCKGSGLKWRYIIRKSIKKAKAKNQRISNRLTTNPELTFSPPKNPLNSHLVASHSQNHRMLRGWK